MAESLGSSPEESVSNGAKAEAGVAKPHDNLPMVIAPKLGAGEEEVDEDQVDQDEVSGEAEAPARAAPGHSSRFLVLAASVAFAAAFGSFVGSVSGSGLAHVLYPAAPAPASSTQNVNDAVLALKLELSNSIKADLDSAARSANAQLTKLGDRLDRLDPHAAAALDVTGSIAPPAPVPPAKLTDRILEDWIVQDVQNGRALIESRYGGLFDVGAGSVLPGVGRVDNVKRQDGQWVVITARGMITSGR